MHCLYSLYCPCTNLSKGEEEGRRWKPNDNTSQRQIRFSIVINVLLMTMKVETKATMRRNTRMIEKMMNPPHYEVHFPISLWMLMLIMKIGIMRPKTWKKRWFSSSTLISTKKTRCSWWNCWEGTRNNTSQAGRDSHQNQRQPREDDQRTWGAKWFSWRRGPTVWFGFN